MNEDISMEGLIEEYQETLEEATYRTKKVLYNFKRRNDDDFHRRMYRYQLVKFAHTVFLLYLESDQLSQFLSAHEEKLLS